MDYLTKTDLYLPNTKYRRKSQVRMECPYLKIRCWEFSKHKERWGSWAELRKLMYICTHHSKTAELPRPREYSLNYQSKYLIKTDSLPAWLSKKLTVDGSSTSLHSNGQWNGIFNELCGEKYRPSRILCSVKLSLKNKCKVKSFQKRLENLRLKFSQREVMKGLHFRKKNIKPGKKKESWRAKKLENTVINLN